MTAVHFRGDMHPSRALRVGKLVEAEIDAHIADGRERYAQAFDDFERWKELRTERRATPSVIALDTSLLARAGRWLNNHFLNRRSSL